MTSEHVKRVTIVSSGLDGGGAHRAPRELADALRAKGLDVDVLVPRRRAHHHGSVRSIRLPGERALRLLDRTNCGRDWCHPGSVFRLGRISQRTTDVVHFHNLHGGWMSIAAAQRLCRRVPVVWTFHDEWPVTPGIPYDLRRHLSLEREIRLFGRPLEVSKQDGPRFALQSRRLRRLLPRPAAIICPSAYLAQLASSSGFFEGVPIHQIPNSVQMLNVANTKLPKCEARAKLGLDPSKPVILLIAAHLDSPYKGTKLAIEALSAFRREEAVVLVLGEGGSAIAGQLQTEVVFKGFVSDDAELALAYRSADVTVVPSLAEIFCYVAIESLVCGTPIVAFRTTALAELIGSDERGLAADPFEVEMLTANIRRLLEDRKLAIELGDAGRRWAETRCDPARVFEQVVFVYDQIYRDFGTQITCNRDSLAGDVNP